ncbi:hypothetical protein RCH09_002554 [Actimicrobium sp. GrIS 1.19]|uniref:hypothetical protein n=1 Tax=Actimicrobium sp. GrIS 1.19 TaxID=3071708 RepID=UPI002E070DEF|nr:hypothetical protein [Actimicrobium sp. GrIS 1.19]
MKMTTTRARAAEIIKVAENEAALNAITDLNALIEMAADLDSLIEFNVDDVPVGSKKWQTMDRLYAAWGAIIDRGAAIQPQPAIVLPGMLASTLMH